MRIAIAVVCAAASFLVPRAEGQELNVMPFVGRTVFLAELPSRFVLRRSVGDDLVVEDGELADPGHLGMSLGLRFGEQFAVEAVAAWMPSSLSSVNVESDVDVFVYGVTGVFFVPVWGRVGPLVGLGFGQKRYNYDAPDVDTDAHFVGNVVGGIAVQLRDDLGLRFEARDCIGRFGSGVTDVDDEWENDLMLSTGLSWRVPLGR